MDICHLYLWGVPFVQFPGALSKWGQLHVLRVVSSDLVAGPGPGGVPFVQFPGALSKGGGNFA